MRIANVEDCFLVRCCRIRVLSTPNGCVGILRGRHWPLQWTRRPFSWETETSCHDETVVSVGYQVSKSQCGGADSHIFPVSLQLSFHEKGPERGPTPDLLTSPVCWLWPVWTVGRRRRSMSSSTSHNIHIFHSSGSHSGYTPTHYYTISTPINWL